MLAGHAAGASFVLQHVFRGMFGSNVRSYPDPEWLKGHTDFLGLSLPAVQPIEDVIPSLAPLTSLIREQGAGALIATHNHDLARRADRIVTLRNGLIEPITL